MTTLIERQREVESLERETYAGTRIIEEAEELLSKRRSRVGLLIFELYRILTFAPRVIANVDVRNVRNRKTTGLFHESLRTVKRGGANL